VILRLEGCPVHHRPAGPPLSARLAGALTRWGLLLRTRLRLRTGRLVLTGLVATAVTALVLAVPVMAGSRTQTSSTVLGSSSSTSASRSSDAGSSVASEVGDLPASGSASPSTGADMPSPTASPSAPAAVDAPAGPSSPSVTEAPSAGPPESPTAGATSSSSTGGTATDSETPAAPESATPSPPVLPAELDAADELLALLDEERQVAGCASLTRDAPLTAVAQAHSEDMRDEDFFGLRDLDGRSLLEQGALAAAIARGESAADDVLHDWLDDPSDAAAIHDCSLVSVGIGHAEGDGGPWWTLLLA
jgi:uncharacterized protein YkwD